MGADKSQWVTGKVLDRQAALRPDAPFMQFEHGEPVTYAEARDLSNRVGTRLQPRASASATTWP